MNIIVFDTETAGLKTQTLLNVGYVIVDINPKTGQVEKELVHRDYIVKSVYQNLLFMLNDMFVGAEKLEQFRANVENGGAILRTLKQIFAQVEADINRFQCVAGYAYNATFDTARFTENSQTNALPNPLSGLPVFDLWGMAYEFICDTYDYHKFCETHGLLTDTKRFFKTSVEAVVAYLTNNPTFSEDHTALSDVQWELMILQECLKRGANPFGDYKHGFLPSLHEFEKTLVWDGEEHHLRYTKTIGKWDTHDRISFINENGGNVEGE